MAKKVVKSKMKQKQKQSQKVIVNISQPKSSRSSVQPRQYLPLMPSFNINPAQPQPLADLAKLFGMLAPKLQSESTLGSAIPVKTKIPESEVKPVVIGEFKNPTEVPTLGEAVKLSIPPKPESLKLGQGTFNIPSGEPVNLKLPPKPETVMLKTDEKRSGSPLKRLVQNIELGRMAKEDKSSRENLYQGPTEMSDLMSEVSTTPLYEGGREVPEPKIKRQYVKSGKYSKKGKKEFAEYQTD